MTLCPRCGAAVDARVLARRAEIYPPLIARIQADNPTWLNEGLCPTCMMQYAQQLVTERSVFSLNVATDPHTTFPYYHPAEETALSQPERLLDYPSFSGRGVTIAFLDSGFFPHPDLLAADCRLDPMPKWETLERSEVQDLLQGEPSRLIHYVDLNDGDILEGTDQPSLWDTARLSWHGQMTSVLAAGNGLMSGGRFRGYAPEANVLPIKVSRSNGSIPESEILAGLQWLLREENWQRYGVRVVNISVGGDFPRAWEESELSLAAEALSERGVLVLAAAGNSGSPVLLPPAQTPSVLTVGGYEDANQRGDLLTPRGLSHCSQYHHNYGEVMGPDGREQKPEILGLARFVPSPLLPATPTFREAHAIGALRDTLSGGDDEHARAIMAHWQRIMHVDDPRLPDQETLLSLATRFDSQEEQTLHEVWYALRKRMNAHKWIHDFYQHVDGTSVAVAQVAAVAAQMFQANPRLTGRQVKTLLTTTAMEMPHWPAEQRGSGIVQPGAAVTAALRAAGGVGYGLPQSATRVSESRLRKWIFQGKVPRAAVLRTGSRYHHFTYFSYYAPHARAVSLIGSFNNWVPDAMPLTRGPNGWWHGALDLEPGIYPYRFWCVDARYPHGSGQRDPENPFFTESGLRTYHSVIPIE